MPPTNPRFQDGEPVTEENYMDETNEEARTLAREAIRPARKAWHENSTVIWVFQGALGILCMLTIGYVTLWMDSHNDTRYERRAEYEKDTAAFLERYKDNRSNDKADRDAIRMSQDKVSSDLNKRLDRMEAQQDTIANDIKSLLRGK